MTSAANKVLEEALSLSEDERAEIIEALSESLMPVELSPEWQTEIKSRIAQLESGEVKPIPWDEVESRIRKSLDRD